jgi:D-alanyl-lipoteichoic acid acyltransferase DltB (MBOAT superfamily)
MSVCSLGFLALCVAVVIVFHLASGRLLRQIILAAANATFLISQVPNLRSWGFFAVVLVATYLALAAVRAFRRGIIVAAAIGLVLVSFLYIKRYEYFATWVPVPMEWDLVLYPVELVGQSYMFFKLIHMFVDEWQGQLAPFNLWSYLNYQLSFFALTAGPIQRYNDFLRSWNEMDLRPRESREALLLWTRILAGMIKISVLGAWALTEFKRAAVPPGPRNLSEVLVCFYVYPAYLYFNFSGYTDMMLGAGGLLGFKLPENFNRPYLARNVLDFWDRWHISVSHWIRDYVFMTSYKVAASQFPRAARYWSYALLFLALFLAGVWHGTTEGFVWFGALNGLGAAVTRAYGDSLRAMLGGAGLKAYLRNRAIQWIAVIVTLHYVGFCFLFFSMKPLSLQLFFATALHELSNLPWSLGGSTWRSLDVTPLVVAALALAALWKAEVIGAVLARLASRIVERPVLMYSILCTQTTIVVLVLYLEWALKQEPPPVLYMSF